LATGAEAVFALVYSGLGAGNHATVQGGVALGLDLEPVVPRLDAALLLRASVVAVNFGGTGTRAGTGGAYA
jgi:hypothetical protein